MEWLLSIELIYFMKTMDEIDAEIDEINFHSFDHFVDEFPTKWIRSKFFQCQINEQIVLTAQYTNVCRAV